jgi:hypothetical protein
VVGGPEQVTVPENGFPTPGPSALLTHIADAVRVWVPAGTVSATVSVAVEPLKVKTWVAAGELLPSMVTVSIEVVVDPIGKSW